MIIIIIVLRSFSAFCLEIKIRLSTESAFHNKQIGNQKCLSTMKYEEVIAFYRVKY